MDAKVEGFECMKKNLEYNLIINLINSDKLFFTQIFSQGRFSLAVNLFTPMQGRRDT
jgi:hypothetical protein